MKYRLPTILLAVLLLSAGLLWWGHNHPKLTTRQQAAKSAAVKTAKPATPPTFNKQLYSLSDPASQWVVVNKLRPLNPLRYAPTDLTSVGNGQLLRQAAASAFSTLVSDAKDIGYSLTADSGYRSYQTQITVYNREVQQFGQAKADTESARPGYSEHQTGWAIDIGTPGCHISDCFGNTAAGKWLAGHAYLYGFILRYTPDKVAITGYRSEPWHFRYVGKPLAAELHKTGLTPEEFFGLPAVGAP